MRRIATALIALLLAACTSGAPEGEWVVTSAEGQRLVEGAEVTLSLKGSEMRVDTGCNTLTGTTSYTDQTLSIKDAQRTLIGCDDDRVAQEEWLGEFFGGGANVALDGDEMTLTRGEVVLKLKRKS